MRRQNVKTSSLRFLGETLASTGQSRGGRLEDLNNVICVPFNTFQYRFWNMEAFLKDDLDGVDLRLKPGADSVEVAKIEGLAALLAQQQRTQTIFTYVMVAIAAISLLVGGIGIMHIVLATVLERTREIGVRRAIGARRKEIVRQFLTESVLISTTGGLLGVGCGFLLAWLIYRTAAFSVSVAVGVIFGIYPAMKASRVNPIEALRYE